MAATKKKKSEAPMKKGAVHAKAKLKAVVKKVATKAGDRSRTLAKPKPAAAKRAPAVAKKTKAPSAARKGPARLTAKEGDPAPGFSLPGSDGKTHSLDEHRGAPVVLYFYPKDDTPGCTREACDFRDNMARAQGAGAVVYGVSRDSITSHQQFGEKYNLNLPLLSDPELAVHRAYGAWGSKTLYGRKSEGVIRSTYLIDREGKLARTWPNVKVDGHVDEVLQAVASLS